MIKQLRNNKLFEFINIQDLKKVKYQLLSSEEVDVLFQVSNKYYQNIFKIKPSIGFSNQLTHYKVLSIIIDSIPIMSISESDRSRVRNYAHKFLYTLIYFYLSELVPMNQSISNVDRFNILDVYHTILFRMLTGYIYVGGLTISQISYLTFLIGRLASTKIVEVDYTLQFKRVKRIFKYVDPNIKEIPEEVSFELFVDLLNNKGMTVKPITIDDLKQAIEKYLSIYGAIMMEDPYHFLTMIYATKIKSPLYNTAFNKYNPSVFNYTKKMITEWIKNIK